MDENDPLTKAKALLRRALPDLKWAEGAARSEWNSELDDEEIIADIEKFLTENT